MFTPHTAARQIVVNKVDMEVFAHGTVAFPVAFYDVDFSVEQFLWHWHDEFEIGVVMEGKMLVTIGSKEYTLKTGEAYFANAGVLHAGRNHAIGEPCRLHIIVFHPVLISGDTRSIFWQEFVHPLMEDHSLQGLHLSKGTLIQQQVVAAQFDLRHQIQLVLLKQLMQIFAGGAFSIQHQDRVILQVFQ